MPAASITYTEKRKAKLQEDDLQEARTRESTISQGLAYSMSTISSTQHSTTRKYENNLEEQKYRNAVNKIFFSSRTTDSCRHGNSWVYIKKLPGIIK